MTKVINKAEQRKGQDLLRESADTRQLESDLSLTPAGAWRVSLAGQRRGGGGETT